MRTRVPPRLVRRLVLRTKLATVLGLTLLPIAAGIAGLATTDLALQTRANPPTMGALEVAEAATPPAAEPPPSTPPPTATAPAVPTGLIVARFVM